MVWPTRVLSRRSDSEVLRMDRDGFGSGACAPRRSCDQTRDPPENGSQDGRTGGGRGQVKPDLGFQLDHPRGDLDQAKAQGVELRHPPRRAFGHQRAHCTGSDRVSPATGGFYIQASDGSVTLPVAGYDYNSDWTPLLAGLSPAGMAASLAAPDLTRFPQPPGAFTSRLPAGRSPFPSLDITTTDGVMGLAWMSCAVRWSSPDRMEVRGHGVHQPQASRDGGRLWSIMPVWTCP